MAPLQQVSQPIQLQIVSSQNSGSNQDPKSRKASNKGSIIVTDKPPSIPVNLSPILRREKLLQKQKEKNKKREFGKKNKQSFSAFYQ